MWFRKKVSQLKFYFANNYYLPEQTNKKNLAIIEALDSLLFKAYSVNEACMYKVRVLYPNLETYIAKLQYINQYLHENRYIQNDWCRYNYLDLSLERFLVNKDKIYSNPVEVIEAFKQEYITYCKNIIAIEHIAIGESEHNTRILSEFSSHLNSITVFLLRYTND